MFKFLVLWVMGLLSNMGLLAILKSERGDAGTGDKTFTQAQVDAMIAEKTAGALTQDKVNAIVEDRLSRERAKYAGHDELVKFKIEHEKTIAAANEKDLEARKEYDKAKETWVTEQQRLTGLITEKDTAIKDMKISSTLMGEIVKQNAYAEETMALIKSQAVFNEQGILQINGVDANGTAIKHSVEEGVKQFLIKRPHLVKATNPNGAGTGAGVGAGAGSGAGAQDLDALNAELQAAMNARDTKKVNELKLKISAIVGAKRSKL